LGQNVAALGGGGGGSYTPMSFPGLQGLYDPDQQTESADAALATFSDRSGNANHWSQASAPERPILRYSVINGRKVLEFDGLSSYMSCATGLMNGATSGSWFALIKLDADPPASLSGPVIDGFGASDSYHPYTDGVIYDGFWHKRPKDLRQSDAEPRLMGDSGGHIGGGRLSVLRQR
jgi:hypothetical protein